MTQKKRFVVLGTVFEDAPPLESQHRLGVRTGGWWPHHATGVFTNPCVSPKFPGVDYTGPNAASAIEDLMRQREDLIWQIEEKENV